MDSLEICCRKKGELRRKIWQAEFKYAKQEEKRNKIVKKLQEQISDLCIVENALKTYFIVV